MIVSLNDVGIGLGALLSVKFRCVKVWH